MFIFSYLKLAIVLAVLLGISFVEFKVYHAGYTSATIKYEARLQAIKQAADAETLREKEANDAALNESQRQVASLQDFTKSLTDELTKASDEDDKAVDAARTCLDIASVRRLNTLGGSGKTHSTPSAHHPKM